MNATQEKRKRAGAPQNLTAMDHALVKAKTQDRTVLVTLAVTTAFTDEEGEFEAQACHVDSFSVLFNIKGRERWIFKAFIVSCEIVSEDD